MDRIYLKKMAKEQTNDKIGVLFLCALIILGLSVLSSAVVGVGSIVLIIITPVLNFGFVLNCLNASRGYNADVKLMFEGFTGDKFGKIWLTYFLVELYTFLWGLLFVIPGIIKSYSYIFAPYILADNPELSPREILKKSEQMTNGYKLDLFILTLSFIGWYFLVVLSAGIAGLYVTPYYNITLANAYNSLKGGNEEIYDDVTEEETPAEEVTPEEIITNKPYEGVDKDLLDELSDN